MKKKSSHAQEKALQIAQENVLQIEADYKQELDTNPEYSLVVDPTNKYKMSSLTKEFIRYYIEYRNIATVANLCYIDNDEALDILNTFPVQQEIRRISRALYHRQFSKKIMTINEIGGFLSSLIEDSDIPIADRLSNKEKLAVVRLLIDINEVKIKAMTDPSVLMMKDISNLVKGLSVGAIKALINQTNATNNVNEVNRNIINITNDERIKKNEPVLSPEESAYIESLSVDEALALLNEQYITKGDKDE